MGQKTQVSQKQWISQREDLLIAIDQLSQMTEVMNDVLSRVKQQVDILDSNHYTHDTSENAAHAQAVQTTKKDTRESSKNISKPINNNILTRKKTKLVH
ncbi:hypothetical protein ACVBE9_08680 [Eionea flava]